MPEPDRCLTPRGTWLAIWPRMWHELWHVLATQPCAPPDLFCDLARDLTAALAPSPDPNSTPLAELANDPQASRAWFAALPAEDIASESALVTFLQDAYATLGELGGETLASAYFRLLGGLIDTYNLRYELRRPCTLALSLPGLFGSLMQTLRDQTGQDLHLATLMREFDHAFRDVHDDATDIRIKTCMQKQINLLEALARHCTGVTEHTLGNVCNQVAHWPHRKVKEAMQNLYAFTSDYPGIRHSGTPGNARRTINMRDMIAMSILLVGFTPYLVEGFDAKRVWRG
ncbi:hypothetical protein [Ralstonia solanacearum]|uniref:hypothetical protein n=1 Tax=Ralstonia solanacearum TaxID=305 RepID=UPI000503DE99|nr:hypothetical protein [Ralstonia solanacearum]KFX27632.1 membrane protein [Ralstonia solanacearum]